MKLLYVFLGSLLYFFFSASSKPKISCLIINLEYVNCTWIESQYNYSFKSSFKSYDTLDCPEYHIIDGVTQGCMFPYKRAQRFNMLQTWLYHQNGSLATEQDSFLKDQVKLYPPNNLSVVERKDAELYLYWNVMKDDQCIESEVRYRTNNDWKSTTPAIRRSFSLPFPSKKRYEFQVRARVVSSCGESLFWSDWSESVYWETAKSTNSTVTLDPISVSQMVLMAVGAMMVLVMLVCLLVHHERLRIILIPVVPNSGRKVGNYFQTLLDKYDGNIDNWLSMPKDLDNSLKPNFTERACPVREYRILSQCSSDGGSSLSNPTDVSLDYQCMRSYSSASTLPGAAEAQQTQISG
ncbi:hypothetical protein DNTS_033433 [Danionella cerebrum]|uniref:Fibronectin type-III domain-containing protein n=1 Tax=Danionella cerebrum TaxID=2873325 RepID=A0A553R929_9TELE|nr:hypothetical protein DNTS_033433 [Danionella translucida]